MAGIIGIHGDHSGEGQGGECGLHLAFPEVALERVEGGFEAGGFGARFLNAGIALEEITETPVEVFLEGRQGVECGVGDFNRLRLLFLLSAAFAACVG